MAGVNGSGAPTSDASLAISIAPGSAGRYGRAVQVCVAGCGQVWTVGRGAQARWAAACAGPEAPEGQSGQLSPPACPPLRQPLGPASSEYGGTDTESGGGGGSFTPGSTGSASPMRRRTRQDSPKYVD